MCLQEFPRQKYHDFGFDSHFLELLPHLVSSAEQETEFFELLDSRMEQEKRSTYYPDYGISQLIKAKISYLRLNDRDEYFLPFLNTHKQLPDFREMLVGRAAEQKDFEIAKQLCREGINIARGKNHPGIVSRWQEKCFDIARLENNLPDMRMWAETVLANSRLAPEDGANQRR